MPYIVRTMHMLNIVLFCSNEYILQNIFLICSVIIQITGYDMHVFLVFRKAIYIACHAIPPPNCCPLLGLCSSHNHHYTTAACWYTIWSVSPLSQCAVYCGIIYICVLLKPLALQPPGYEIIVLFWAELDIFTEKRALNVCACAQAAAKQKNIITVCGVRCGACSKRIIQ